MLPEIKQELEEFYRDPPVAFRQVYQSQPLSWTLIDCTSQQTSAWKFPGMIHHGDWLLQQIHARRAAELLANTYRGGPTF